MSKILAFPNREQIYEQASQWIAKLDRGLSDAEQQALVAWMQHKPEHRQVMLEMAKLWDKMDSLARLADLFEAPPRAQRQYRFSRVYLAAAASFLLATLGIVWSLGNVYLSQQQILDGIYETAIGEHSTISLPDGSQLVLNTNSRILVKYTTDHRLLVLERGEVNVDVAHDQTRPLSVMAGNKIVQAVGTAFNVKLRDNQQVELLVTDGKVRVAARQPQQPQQTASAPTLPESAMAVSKGETVTLGALREEIAHIEDADIAVQLSWRQGNLIFRGETLEQALIEISRYTSIEFEVLDEDIKQERIAGLFKAGDVKGLLTTLSQNFNIDSELQGENKVLLRSR